MERDIITIIIPIYKVEKYLKKCVQSVINQTYSNLEIILVDDGSPDNCGKICDDYAKEDKRIKVIHKLNGGLSDARNKGLDIATGKYVYFLDSDDSISKDAIKYLYHIIKENNADIAIGKMKEVFKENYSFNQEEILLKENLKDTIKLYTKEQALEEMLYNTEFTNMACNKLYKKRLFSKIRYPVGMLYEDLGTTYKLISCSEKVVLGSKITYYYLANRKESIMNKNYNSTRMQALKFAEEILEFIQREYPKIEKAAIARLYMECIFILLKIPRDNKYKKDNDKIKDYLRKYRWIVINNKKMPIKQKVLCVFAIGGRIPLRIVWKLKEWMKRRK